MPSSFHSPEDDLQTTPPWLRRIALHVGASVAIWFVGGFLIRRRLEWEVAQDYATGRRISTDGDSIGLPLGTFFLLWAVVIIISNVGIAYWAARRRAHRQ